MSLKDRENAFENKYAHEAKLGFELEAKCCKLFGLWVAEQIGLENADALTYAKEVVESNLEEAGFDDVLRKVKGDLDAKGIEISDHLLRLQLDSALEEAKKLMAQKS